MPSIERLNRDIVPILLQRVERLEKAIALLGKGSQESLIIEILEEMKSREEFEKGVVKRCLPDQNIRK